MFFGGIGRDPIEFGLDDVEEEDGGGDIIINGLGPDPGGSGGQFDKEKGCNVPLVVGENSGGKPG